MHFLFADPSTLLVSTRLICKYFGLAMASMLKLRTTDGAIVELEEQYATKSCLLKNILETVGCSEPVDILVDSETLLQIRAFMACDNHVLRKDYNPLEIYFSQENLTFFDGLSPEQVIGICNAANYLEYLFLLELCCKLIANDLTENSKSEMSEIVKGTRKLDDEASKRVQQEFEWFDEAL